MTRDEIIRMARECGLHLGGPPLEPGLERLARAAYEAGAAAEREACAKACENELVDVEATNDESDRAYNSALGHATAAIRARGEK